MDKIFWIEADRLAGRCGPSMTPLNLTRLEAAGFHHILSLDANEYKLLDGRAAALETTLIHLPNSIPPEPLERKIYETRLPEAVDHLIQKVSQAKGAVLVHCHAGNDRTGGVLTGYLCRTQGLTPEAALARVREANPQAITAPGYEEMTLAILHESCRG